MTRSRAQEITLQLAALLGSLLLLPRFFDSFAACTIAGTALLILAARRIPEGRGPLLWSAALLPWSLFCTGVVNLWVSHLTPHTADAQLSALDGGASLAFWHWTQTHTIIAWLLLRVYDGLPLAVALSMVLTNRRRALLSTLMATAVAAPVFYLMVPATGPALTHDSYAARNCMPSLHLTWALLCAAYIAPRYRWAAVAFAILTAIATIATGQHYLVDLAAALPYCAAFLMLEDKAGKLRFPARLAEPVSPDA